MIIAVSSGKGGVGKTSVSLNLSIALSRLGKKVWLLDADMGLANINILLGVQPTLTLYHILFEGKTLEEVAFNGPSGVKIIPGGSGVQALTRPDKSVFKALSSAFSNLSSESDFLIVDTSAGISPENLAFSRAADAVLVIFTPEPTSLTDGFAVIKILCVNQYAGGIYLLPNMFDSEKSAAGTTEKVKEAAAKFLSRKLESLPPLLSDKAVVDAVIKQRPFMESGLASTASVRMGEIANQVVSISESRGDKKTAPADYVLDVVDYAHDTNLLNLVKKVNEKRAEREEGKPHGGEQLAQAQASEWHNRASPASPLEAAPPAASGAPMDTKIVAGLLQHMEGQMKTMASVFEKNAMLYEKTLEILSSISEKISSVGHAETPMRDSESPLRPLDEIEKELRRIEKEIADIAP
jgi:flagellar biosynthesis protein FlhG